MPSGIIVEAKIGEKILDIALNQGVSIQHACGGFCACTTCHCEILEGASSVSAIEEDEAERLEVLDEKTPSSRLACQTRIKGDVTVRVVNPE